MHLTGGKDPRDHDADIGLSVIPDNRRIDNKGEEGELVLGRVILEKCRGIIIADGFVRRTLSAREDDERTEQKGKFIQDLHCFQR